MKPAFKILSIDGGGIRGVIPCRILEFMDQQLGGNLASHFDLMSGTSTGGIISIGLASRKPGSYDSYTPAEMLDLYREHGGAIFHKRKTDFLSKIGSILNVTEQLTANPYDVSNMENILEQYFGDRKLSEVKTDILITTYDIEVGKPFYFSSRLAKKTDMDSKEDFLIREIARSTSAAPTYFEPKILEGNPGDELVFVDGGVFANNPSILAYSEAKELYKATQARTFIPVVTASNEDLPIYLLSLGTGTCPQSISGKDASKWRAAEWLSPLLSSIFMQSVAESTHYTMEYLLPPYTDGTPRYQRFNMHLPEELSPMDNASKQNIDALCDVADKYIEEHEDELLSVCELLSAD